MHIDYFVSNDVTMMHYNLHFFYQGHILRVYVAFHQSFSEKIEKILYVHIHITPF